MKQQITEVLKQVFDPEIPVNIVDLGLVYDINIDDKNNVLIQMTMTSPTCPMSEEIMEMARSAAASVPGVIDVNIDLVWNPPWSIDKMSEQARLELDLTNEGW